MGEILKRERPCIPMNDTPVQNEEYGIHDEKGESRKNDDTEKVPDSQILFHSPSSLINVSSVARRKTLIRPALTVSVTALPSGRISWPSWEVPAATYVKNGADVEVVFPKEGAIFPGESVQIIKGAKHMENAKKFVDFMLSQKIQEAAGKTLTVRPLRKGVKLADYMTPQDTIALFKNYDEGWVAAHKKEVVAEWNKHLENSRQ